jgi:hypothetical protein
LEVMVAMPDGTFGLVHQPSAWDTPEEYEIDMAAMERARATLTQAAATQTAAAPFGRLGGWTIRRDDED